MALDEAGAIIEEAKRMPGKSSWKQMRRLKKFLQKQGKRRQGKEGIRLQGQEEDTGRDMSRAGKRAWKKQQGDERAAGRVSQQPGERPQRH